MDDDNKEDTEDDDGRIKSRSRCGNRKRENEQNERVTKQRWSGHVERNRGRCSNENMVDGSKWTLKDGKTETDMEIC